MADSEPRVFLDTNVIFSALYFSRGSPGRILEYGIAGHCSIVISRQVLEELIRTIKMKFPRALPALRKLLESIPLEITADPTPEEIRRWIKQIPPADAAILAAAMAAKVDYFVTGDNHFLSNSALINEAGLNIVSPTQLMVFLEQKNTGIQRMI